MVVELGGFDPEDPRGAPRAERLLEERVHDLHAQRVRQGLDAFQSVDDLERFDGSPPVRSKKVEREAP